MCSIGEDDFGDEGSAHTMVSESVSNLEKERKGICNKCGKEDVVLFKLNCRDCFLAQTRHKFRATLGSSKVLPRNANVMIVFDGRAESVVLLDMVHYAQLQNMFKRLHCSVKVLYIDDETLLTESYRQCDSDAHIMHVRDCLRRYEPFESFILPISGGRPISFGELDYYLLRDRTKDVLYLNKTMSIKNLTSQQDFTKICYSRLIADAAKQLGCDFAFTADTSSTLAVKLLSAIALGRGGSAALDVSLLDNRYNDQVKIVRPLRDLTDLEIKLYLRIHKLEPIRFCKGLGGKQSATASLQNMTLAFVESLQENYASTVSTIFRTGDKIAANRSLVMQLDENDKTQTFECLNCKSPLDTSQSTTLEAIEFSRTVSEIGSSFDRNLDLDVITKRLHINENTMFEKLCRGCRNILDDCDKEEFFL